jgi:hypothetical protein
LEAQQEVGSASAIFDAWLDRFTIAPPLRAIICRATTYDTTIAARELMASVPAPVIRTRLLSNRMSIQPR